MKDDLLYSEENEINSNFLKDSLTEKIIKIKNSINYRFKKFSSKEKDNLTLKELYFEPLVPLPTW